MIELKREGLREASCFSNDNSFRVVAVRNKKKTILRATKKKTQKSQGNGRTVCKGVDPKRKGKSTDKEIPIHRGRRLRRVEKHEGVELMKRKKRGGKETLR